MATKKKIIQETPVDKPLEVKAEPTVNTVLAESRLKKKQFPGDWKKVTLDELKSLEDKGLLMGYNPETNEALIKETK